MKILSLTDDLDFAKLIGNVMKLGGLKFDNVTTSSEAWPKLLSGEYDLLLINEFFSKNENWGMLYDQVKSHSQLSGEVGIILITPKTDIRRDILSNGDRFLIAPFPVAEFLLRIREVLSNYRKVIPSSEEREKQFELYRSELKIEYGWTDQEIDERRAKYLWEVNE